MDSVEMPPYNERVNKGFNFSLMRFIVSLVFSIFILFFLAILIGILAILFGESSVSSSIFVASQCKIVSSSVDIRSAKVCELGVLNYKAKRVFYPFEGSKFRCRYDYYWASVFKVEYVDHSLGHTRLAFSEAPNEALPLSCRPSFGAAWLTKDKFKVNETYDCWYAVGISKVILYRNGFFSCQAKDPSPIEMIQRYFFMAVKILQSWFVSKKKAKNWGWETVAGLTTGFMSALITISIAGIIQQMKPWMLARVFTTTRFKHVFFLLVYLSVTGWVAIMYVKRLGGLLKNFLRV